MFSKQIIPLFVLKKPQYNTVQYNTIVLTNIRSSKTRRLVWQVTRQKCIQEKLKGCFTASITKQPQETTTRIQPSS